MLVIVVCFFAAIAYLPMLISWTAETEENEAEEQEKPKVTVVLHALIRSQVVSTWRGSMREVFPDTIPKNVPKNVQKARVVKIVKIGKSYFWASHDSRELVYRKNGLFHTFTDVRAGSFTVPFMTHERGLWTNPNGFDTRLMTRKRSAFNLSNVTHMDSQRTPIGAQPTSSNHNQGAKRWADQLPKIV